MYDRRSRGVACWLIHYLQDDEDAKKRQALRRVYLRDDELCGIHLGGCGKEILPGQNYNRDHIIPRSLFRKVSRGRENEFEQDWNCQPMHEDCNSSKSFQLDGWPRFGCECHYLQVVEG